MLLSSSKLIHPIAVAFVFLTSSMTASRSPGDVNKVGNGGDAVICENEPEKVQLLDLYELKDKTNLLTLKTAEPAVSYEKFVEMMIDRIEQASPKLGRTYRNRWSEFLGQVEWVKDKKLADVKDSLHTEEPLADDCKFVQLAVRIDKIADGEKRFQIRQDLWDQLSPLGRAGLVMHELLYQHFARLGEKDSRSARKVNRLLLAKNFEAKSFWKLVKDLRVPIYPD